MLETTLDARTEGGNVELALWVENAGGDPVTLTFPDARRAEFVARADRDGNGEEVWRWSRGRMFAQSVGEVTLPPGATRAFEVTWEGPEPGTYRIEAHLAAAGVDRRTVATVTVPG